MVTDAAQSTAKGAKKDLNAELEALMSTGPWARVVSAVTDSSFDVDELRALAAAIGGTVERIDDSRTEVTVPLASAGELPDELGGPRRTCEVLRTAVLDIRHARWRDRRVRRLARVQVYVDQMWATLPAH